MIQNLNRDITLFIILNLIPLLLSKYALKNIYVIHTIIILLILNFIRKLLIDNRYYDNLKYFLIITGIIIYLYKDTYLISSYKNYIYYILFINIIIMTILPLQEQKYHLALQIILLAFSIPIKYGLMEDNNPKKFWFHIAYILILFTLYIYGEFFRHWSLFVLTAIIPMMIKYNKNPKLYRVIGLAIAALIDQSTKIPILQAIDYKESIFNSGLIGDSHLAQILYNYTDISKYYSFYYILLAINYLVLLKRFSYK